jgi:hypothetical protein
MLADSSESEGATSRRGAAHQLAVAVTAARLSGGPVDRRPVERYAAHVLGKPAHQPPPEDQSLPAQLGWATAELTSLLTWIDGLPESLALISTACADISVEALRELADLKQTNPEAELRTVTTRTVGDQTA